MKYDLDLLRNFLLRIEDGDDMLVKRITFAGCEYLELIRSDSMWEKTKAKLTEIGGALSLTVVQEVVASIIRMGS